MDLLTSTLLCSVSRKLSAHPVTKMNPSPNKIPILQSVTGSLYADNEFLGDGAFLSSMTISQNTKLKRA